MTNIPTDLLRTLIAVVDLRSFTRAAQSLGVTQPAVSAQIKRLQFLLGAELLDKSAPGVILTETGERVVSDARRLLAINDQILRASGPRQRTLNLRLGVPGDLVGATLPWTLARFRAQSPGMRFTVRTGALESLLRDLKQGELDLAVGNSTAPPGDARSHWTEELVWLRASATRIDPAGPVPLVAYGANCTSFRAAVSALSQAGRDCELVYSAPSAASLAAAVAAGFGVMAQARACPRGPDVMPWDDGPLPRLPPVFCGIYLREGGEREELERLADTLAAQLGPERDGAARDSEASAFTPATAVGQ